MTSVIPSAALNPKPVGFITGCTTGVCRGRPTRDELRTEFFAGEAVARAADFPPEEAVPRS